MRGLEVRGFKGWRPQCPTAAGRASPAICESVRSAYGQITLFLPRRLIGGSLLDRCSRFFGGYKNHFAYHQDRENRRKYKNVSAKSTQVEVFHGLVIGRINPDK